MASPAIQVVSPTAVQANPYSRLTAADEILDVGIQRLRLQSTLAKAGIFVDVTNQVTTGSVTDSFTSAPQVVIECLDRNYKALTSGIFNDTVEITLDDAQYRLVQVSLIDTETLELTFEHKIVALLRTHKKWLAVQRGAVTRAQFIELLLREILPDFGEIVYVCPELNTVQPVAGSRKTGRSLTKKTLSAKTKATNVKRSSFGLTSLPIRYWDGTMVTLDQTQLRNASIALETAYQMGASAKATLALIEACIVEPNKPFENTAASQSNGTSVGILQMGGGGTSAPWASDVALSCQHALQDPGATGRGGMISLARQNPSWSAGQVAQAEQGSAVPSRYDMAQEGAQAVIDAYKSAGGFAATGASALPGVLAATSQYEFTRGRAGQTEDSYTCALRVAAEVQWRFFVAGRRTVYFLTDDDLLADASAYEVTPDSQGIARPTFDIEKGARTIVIRRHRVPKPSEAQIAVRVNRLQATVGNVVRLAGYGPADDRWLIKQIDRDLFDKSGTLYLQAPQKALPEPAASTSTNVAPIAPGSSPNLKSGNPVDRVYAAAQAISARDLPYVYGGGHTGTWSTAAQATGLDCSSSVSLALYAAGLMPGYSAPIVSGDFATWGQPGRGSQMTVWCNSVHVFIEFYGYPAKRFDTVPGGSGSDGPHLRYTAPGSPLDTWEATGFTARHWPGL